MAHSHGCADGSTFYNDAQGGIFVFLFFESPLVPCHDATIFSACWQSLPKCGLTCPRRPLDTVALHCLCDWWNMTSSVLSPHPFTHLTTWLPWTRAPQFPLGLLSFHYCGKLEKEKSYIYLDIHLHVISDLSVWGNITLLLSHLIFLICRSSGFDPSCRTIVFLSDMTTNQNPAVT